jgi:hypothetical protein
MNDLLSQNHTDCDFLHDAVNTILSDSATAGESQIGKERNRGLGPIVFWLQTVQNFEHIDYDPRVHKTTLFLLDNILPVSGNNYVSIKKFNT